MPASKLAPCPDCGHLISPQADACPSCGRRLRPARPQEGLFLRTLNQLVAVAFWGPLLYLGVLVVVALIAHFLWFR